MKKIWLILSIVVILIGFSVFTASAEDKISASLSERVWSRYLGATGNILHKHPVLQTDLFVIFPKGFYFDAWNSTELGKCSFSNETDLTAGWAGNIWKKFYIDTGMAYYDCYHLFRGEESDAFAPYFEVGRPFEMGKFFGTHTVTPFGRIEINLPTGDLDSGVYAYAGLKHIWNISQKFQMKQKINSLYDNGSFGAKPGWIGQYESGLCWKILEKKSFIKEGFLEPLNIKARTPISSFPGRKSEIIFGIGITLCL